MDSHTCLVSCSQCPIQTVVRGNTWLHTLMRSCVLDLWVVDIQEVQEERRPDPSHKKRTQTFAMFEKDFGWAIRDWLRSGVCNCSNMTRKIPIAHPKHCIKKDDKRNSLSQVQLLTEQRETVHTLLFSWPNHLLISSPFPSVPFCRSQKKAQQQQHSRNPQGEDEADRATGYPQSR